MIAIAQDLIQTEMSLGAHNYKPIDVILSRGEGVWLWDVDGNRYLDCLSAYSAVDIPEPDALAAAEHDVDRFVVVGAEAHLGLDQVLCDRVHREVSSSGP